MDAVPNWLCVAQMCREAVNGDVDVYAVDTYLWKAKDGPTGVTAVSSASQVGYVSGSIVTWLSYESWYISRDNETHNTWKCPIQTQYG